MAKKKKTMVVMPGAMTDLAHSVQKGARPAPTTNIEDNTTDEQAEIESIQYIQLPLSRKHVRRLRNSSQRSMLKLLEMLTSLQHHQRPCKSVWSCRAKTRGCRPQGPYCTSSKEAPKSGGQTVSTRIFSCKG